MSTLYTITVTTQEAAAYYNSNNTMTAWEGDEYVTLEEARKMIGDACSGVQWKPGKMEATMTGVLEDGSPYTEYFIISEVTA